MKDLFLTLIREFKPLLDEAGVNPASYTLTSEELQFFTDCNWLEKAIEHFEKIRTQYHDWYSVVRLVSPEVWDRYKVLNANDLREVRMRRAAADAFKKAYYSDRPAILYGSKRNTKRKKHQ